MPVLENVQVGTRSESQSGAFCVGNPTDQNDEEESNIDAPMFTVESGSEK